MDSGWKSVTVDEIKSPRGRAVAMGPFGSNIRKENFRPSGVPVIRGLNLNAARFFDDGFVFVSEEKADELAASNAFPEDIVFTAQGSVGQVGIIPQNAMYKRYVLSQNLMKVTCDPRKADPQFVFYFFRSRLGQHEILSRVNPTGVPCISQPLTSLKTFRVTIPPLPEQRAIAHLLGTLDDKIEVNRRMNETLEATARAIFKSWFVDYDPSHAKMEGSPPFGMDAETAALFPDAFEDSPLGKIPARWRVVRLGDVVEVIRGRSYSSNQLLESGTALITLKSFNRGGGYRPGGLKPYTGPYKREQVAGPGELAVACTDVTQAAAVIGKPAIVPHDSRFETLVASLDVAIVRPRSDAISIPFLYCLFRTDDFQTHIYGHTTGTTVLHLSKEAIPDYLFACPPTGLARAFRGVAAPLFDKSDLNDQETTSLASIRDALLPRLLSGEVCAKTTKEIAAASA
jgi:type I restriction enzyme S subunit